MKLDLGTVLLTRDITNKAKEDPDFGSFIVSCTERFSNFDWGVLPEEAQNLNKKALNPYEPGMLHVIYIFPKTDDSVWIIQEANRSYTTVLFPSEY